LLQFELQPVQSLLLDMLIFVQMANKLKSKKSKAANPEHLEQEKELSLPVQDVIKDERTRKIIGAVLLLLAFFLVVAFISYLFTWKEDQDKVRDAAIFSLSNDVKTANLLGNLGAYVSHFFFYKAFGVASFLLCSFFFVAGANLLFAKKMFSVWRNIKYVVTGILFFSVAFAFIFRGNAFSWGGGLGDSINEWLVRVLGTIGTSAVLLVAGLAWFIWRFNPAFNMPLRANKKMNSEPQQGEDVLEEDAEAAKLYVEATLEKKKKSNALKAESSGVVVIPLKEKHTEPEFTLTNKWTNEKPDNAMEVVKPAEEWLSSEIIQDDLVKPSRKGKLPANLELEIKNMPVDQTALEEESDGRKEPVPVVTTPYEPTLDLRDYKYPSLDLLELHGSERIIQDPAELDTNKNQIINTLKNYDITIQKIAATVGPTVTLYEIVPAAGVRISRIKNLEDDIALSLAALGIRIIAPIPGKGTIGIEVPNVKKTVVSMRTLLSSDKFQSSPYSLPIAIGKKIDNENFIVDLTTMPHLLMAGATGQGKSVGLNAILVSLLYKKHPSQLKLVLVDPKKVELSIYRTIEKHFLAKLPGEEDAIITDTKKVIHTLNALCIEMDNRYDLLKEAGTRNIKEYNEKFIKRKLNPEKGHQYLPFIVLVVDEFADLIMTAGKEVEMPIARLAQLARAVGIHLIIATQRPSVNIITGTIKANFPVRVAFKVSSKIDSRTILDTGGAEQLIGKGDMLISYNGELTRLQCAFVDTPEVEEISSFIGEQRGYPQAFLLPEYIDEKELEGKEFDLNNRDPLFDDAARLIVQSQVGSTSLLQRRMKLGYNRAGRLMDQLEAAGIVGPNQGSKARDVLIKTEVDLQMHLDNL
jgi:S-DNA-T family DNA segregation ATPase FtsK/SpoIIIE